MASSMTLTTAKTRLLAMLGPLAVGYTVTSLEQAIRTALEEYSQASIKPGAPVRPNITATSVTPSNGARETSLSALTGLLGVQRVAMPYTANAVLTFIDFEILWLAGVPYLYHPDNAGDASAVARVFWYAPHTLNGLDSASGTTFDAPHENLILKGAAGYFCTQHLTDSIAHKEAATIFLSGFASALQPAKRIRSVRTRNAGATPEYYDPNLLEARE